MESAQMLEDTSPNSWPYANCMQINECTSGDLSAGGTLLVPSTYWSGGPAIAVRTLQRRDHVSKFPVSGSGLARRQEGPRERRADTGKGSYSPQSLSPTTLVSCGRGKCQVTIRYYTAMDFVDLRDSRDRGHRRARIDFNPTAQKLKCFFPALESSPPPGGSLAPISSFQAEPNYPSAYITSGAKVAEHSGRAAGRTGAKTEV